MQAVNVSAQSLTERLDEERFLRGLTEMQLEDVLRHYVEAHPPADPGRAAQYEIAVERMTLHDLAAAPAARLAALERVLARRAALIDAEVDDLRGSIWLADQAADLFFELLPYETSGLTTLVGLPSPDQRARAERVAREMNAAAAEAELAIEQTLMDLERQEGFARDVAAQLRRQRLDREERRLRIPFLRGVAAFLTAELGLVAENERADWYGLAADLLDPLTTELRGGLGSRTRLYAAMAMQRLGETVRATALLDQVIADEATAGPDRFLARVVRDDPATLDPAARLAALSALESEYPRGPEHVVYRLLLADRRHRVMRAQADAASGSTRDELMSQAFTVYTRLLDEDHGVPAGTWRELVDERLTGAADGDLPVERLPVVVLIARAERLAADAETRADALELLESILERDDVDVPERATALFAVGRVLEASDRPLDAARRYAELAREHPEHPQSERAIEQAAALAAAADRRSSTVEARTVFRETLELLVSRYPNLSSIDQWRALAGRVAVSDERYDDAIEAFASVGPDSRYWLESQLMQASAARSAAMMAEGDTQRARRESALETIDHVRPLIESGLDAREETRVVEARRYLATLRVLEAGLQLELNRPQRALTVLEGLEGEAGLDGALVAEALRLRINALRALDRAADAQREAARFVEAAPDEAGRVIGAMLAAVQREVQALYDISREDEAASRARDELVPLANMLEQWMQGRTVDDERRLELERRIADAHRLAGQWPEALDIYERLLAEHPHALQLLHGRAECLFGIGGEGLAEAMTIYRRLGAAGPGDDSLSRRSYWQAQVRMLQILDRTSRNTAKIAPRIQRLRQQDPELGGERFRRQLEVLQNKYS